MFDEFDDPEPPALGEALRRKVRLRVRRRRNRRVAAASALGATALVLGAAALRIGSHLDRVERLDVAGLEPEVDVHAFVPVTRVLPVHEHRLPLLHLVPLGRVERGVELFHADGRRAALALGPHPRQRRAPRCLAIAHIGEGHRDDQQCQAGNRQSHDHLIEATRGPVRLPSPVGRMRTARSIIRSDETGPPAQRVSAGRCRGREPSRGGW